MTKIKVWEKAELSVDIEGATAREAETGLRKVLEIAKKRRLDGGLKSSYRFAASHNCTFDGTLKQLAAFTKEVKALKF